MPNHPSPKRPLLQQAEDALADMIDLVEAWASCGPEGNTPDEKRRVKDAEKVLDRLRRASTFLR